MRDYARAADGGPGIHIRTFNPISQSFDYTRAGRAWLQNHEVDFVAHIPVRIETQRRNGTIATYYGHFPVSGLPQPLDRDIMRSVDTGEGRAGVKERIICDMRLRGIGKCDANDQLDVVHVESD